MSSTSRSSRTRPTSGHPGYAQRSAARVARAADLAGGEVRRLARTHTVRRAVDRAKDVARDTADRLPSRAGSVPLQPADLSGIPTTALLVDARQAREARRAARSLGLPRTLDGAAAWSALGGLAALMRVADDGRRRAVVIDSSGPRSLFSRWVSAVGFAPVALDLSEPETVGTRIDPGGADLITLLYPRTADPEDVDLDLAYAAPALRRGGLVSVTVQLGPARTGGFGVADLRALMARAAEQGLAAVGDLDLADVARARAAQKHRQDRPIGLALLTFRRR